MANQSKLLSKLEHPKSGVRYDACEELRVATTLTQDATQALDLAANDSDALVADAAQRALAAHVSPTPQTPFGEPAAGALTTRASAIAEGSWFVPFLGYGTLAALPVPFLGWLWLILSVVAAAKLGWARGAMGLGMFVGTAILLTRCSKIHQGGHGETEHAQSRRRRPVTWRRGRAEARQVQQAARPGRSRVGEAR
jgi:hypothetical protein